MDAKDKAISKLNKELSKILKIEKKSIKVQTVNISSCCTSSQTDSLPDSDSKPSQTITYDLNYDISEPLPEIFKFNLCHISPQIRFLSRSLPNINTILWVKPDENFEEEAEEALNWLYDREIDDFFREHQRKALARKIGCTCLL